jgi:hypothetical protein
MTAITGEITRIAGSITRRDHQRDRRRDHRQND